MKNMQHLRLAFIGSAGIPNRYGGFESFLEHCAPVIASFGHQVIVTCDSQLYPEKSKNYRGVDRVFLRIPANGGWSILHDLIAFFWIQFKSTHIVVLGVSGALWFPLFRLLCNLSGKRLIVNIDGVEWRRSKFGPGKRHLLRFLDYLAQKFSHHVIYDSEALEGFLLNGVKSKASCIAYPGDHVQRNSGIDKKIGTALTICRIEPENNLELLIEGVLRSNLESYTIVGNWENSKYSMGLRARYSSERRLILLNPIYDPDAISILREGCSFYIHGHSVGGTNPSLVEMLFYESIIVCYDVLFNRKTAGDCAIYFNSVESLAVVLNTHGEVDLVLRRNYREKYNSIVISAQYINVAKSV
jgi:glycosyltransferase involved in cell wall biosynthesis